LSVDRANEGAIELYRRHGFERVGEDDDSVTMLARLDPTNERADTE
jgi:ribosomal protein S18 acetylase RimI-like enzyme